MRRTVNSRLSPGDMCSQSRDRLTEKNYFLFVFIYSCARACAGSNDFN